LHTITKKPDDLPLDNVAELAFTDVIVPLIALSAVRNLINASVLLTTLRLIVEKTVGGIYVLNVDGVLVVVTVRSVTVPKTKQNYLC